jgi:hypothetical protein
MSTYIVTLSHHSISRAPQYEAWSIEAAMKIGDEEFSGGFNDHLIVVSDEDGNIVATRKLADDAWDELY